MTSPVNTSPSTNAPDPPDPPYDSNDEIDFPINLEEEDEGIEEEEEWPNEVYWKWALLRVRAGVVHSRLRPPATWKSSPACVRAWFDLSNEQQGEEKKIWNNLSRSEKDAATHAIPGYQDQHNRRANRRGTHANPTDARRTSRPATTRRTRTSRRTTAADPSSPVRRGLGTTGLADSTPERVGTANTVAKPKVKRRKVMQAAKTKRQVFGSDTRRSREALLNSVARHIRLTTMDDGSANGYRVLLAIENDISDSGPGGGRPKKADTMERDKVEFLCIGHRLQDKPDLVRWSKKLLKATKAKESDIDLVMLGQRQNNDLCEDVKRFNKSKHRFRGVDRPQDHAATLEAIAGSGATMLMHSPQTTRLRRSYSL